jgi:hypothetical protein
MDDAIYDGVLEHEALSDPTIQKIVDQLKKHPLLERITNPVVTAKDVESAFKCVPEKTASSPSGRGVHHSKACAEDSSDGLSDILCEVYATMMTVPLETSYCPERWKQAIAVMLENIPRVSRSDKLRIIQLLEADLNKVLWVAFARNITKLEKKHDGIISEHQYGRAHKTCMMPVLNKLFTVKLLIQKRTVGNVFDNDAKGCYEIIVSGIALAAIRRIGYSNNSVNLVGRLW